MTSADVSRFTPDQWHRLETRLLAALTEEVPRWTDQSAGDPGITLVELFAFLGEQLIARADALSEPARARLFAIAAKLESVAGNDREPGARVCVDGEEWHQAEALVHAGPDDRVFVVNDDQDVVFGDGRHGRVPPSGGSVFVSYRQGAGESGDARVSVTTRWPPTPLQCEVVMDRSGIRVKCRA